MFRHDIAPQKRGPSTTVRPKCGTRIVLAGLFLLVPSLLLAQATTAAEMFPILDLHAPLFFPKITQTPLALTFNSQFNLEQLRFPIFWRTPLLGVHPALNQLSRSSSLVRYRFTTDVSLSSNRNSWIRGFANNALTVAPTYDAISHRKPHRTASTEHYVRHIPTAGPFVMRIYQETKAHPRFTRVISMFRPEP
jgi:hypothetical protein